MRGYIYLIHAKGTNLYKIGLTTRSIEVRLKELNGKQSPHELLLRHSIEVEDVKVAEEYFHRVYRSYNYRNEWFKFSKAKIFSVVRSMNSYNSKPSILHTFIAATILTIGLAGVASSTYQKVNVDCFIRGVSCHK